ncbi:glycosyl hydrolase-related protein [Streptomyces sp. NBC_01476]|uniref:alpha-mannosidase n=1 Tax=Streptomyces sp. NBC_01476 TaxID=2903881 RepID=UPI002E356236|nr:glycoside hydrolase family 38 C-terminal domain-containing protein [Streptomyces sp. NBC_01476]
MRDRITSGESGEDRIAAFLAERLRPALYPQRLPMDIGAWHIPGEPAAVDVASRAPYVPFAAGDSWGQPWSTTWFTMRARVPQRWAGRRVEALIDLGDDPAGGRAEGLVHDEHGVPVQGLTREVDAVLVATAATGGAPVRLLVEAAANPAIDGGTGTGLSYGSPVTCGDTLLYRLRRADLAPRDENVWQLLNDVETLDRLMRSLPAGQPRRHELLTALESAVDAVDPGDVAGTAALARTVLAPALRRPAPASAPTLAAVGHAHPGPAWRWPVRESVRGCARTFSTFAQLAEEYPELTVAAPSAQHYAWMKEHQPSIFERIRKAVADGNWTPVGGMWVEADTELAGGEALVRQFGHGRRFFRDELGADGDGVWLPAAPGASAALPQLAVLSGARWFLGRRPDPGFGTAPPYHTFRWEGLDGTRLFTHLAPADGDPAGGELPVPAADFAGADTVAGSLLPFGGGTGPGRAALERARRLAGLEGAPRVVPSTPAAFFRDAEQEFGQGSRYGDAPVWRGGLDLAAHRGTYTSQSRTKRGNRTCEALLHEAELWSATAAVRLGVRYPYDELDALWKKVLLQQRQDVLGGTSIAWVHEEAEQAHREAGRRLDRLIRRAAGDPDGASVLNPAPHARREVVVLGPGTRPGTGQPLADGRFAVLAEAPALGAGTAGLPLGDLAPATVRPVGASGEHLLENGLLRVRVDADGLVRSVVETATGRETIAPGGAGNLLRLLRDEPAGWSARHLHPRAGRDLDTAQSVEIGAAGPLLATLRVVRGTGRSRIVQELTLRAGSPQLVLDTEVDWRERDHVLKVCWPLDVHAEHATAEVQFGHVTRPAHDTAEHAAHRWVHVSEHRWGVALASDATYGYDVSRDARPDGGTTTLLRGTLLRAPHSPDPYADRGPHRFRHTLRPGACLGDAIRDGYALGRPLRPGPSAPPRPPLVAVDHPDVLIETVKLADDRSGDVVVRLYESRGGRARTTLSTDFPLAAVHATDLLEEHPTPLAHAATTVTLTLRPFQIRTLRLRRAAQEGTSLA